MKKTALLRFFALFALTLFIGGFAQAQIKITPVSPTSPPPSSSDTKSVYKCINCTYCDINDKNELVNCVQKDEVTTFVLDITSTGATVTIIKPLKKIKYTIESFESETSTGTLELRVVDDTGYSIKYATITFFGSQNLISVQNDLDLFDYDSSWDYDTSRSKLGGTMEIYEMEH